MRKKSAVQRFLFLLVFIVFPLAGYLTVGGSTACRAAEAQCACSTCVTGTGVSGAFQAVGASLVTPGLTEARDALMTYFGAVTASFTQVTQARVTQVSENVNGWFDTFWSHEVRPSLQEMTDALGVANAEQAMALGGFTDAINLSHVKRAKEDMALEAERRQRPGGGVCVAGTVLGGMTRAAVLGRAYGTAASAEQLQRSANTEGTPAASAATDKRDRWEAYVSRYCRKGYNNGASGCKDDQAFADQDIDVAGTIFLKDTINLKDKDVKRTVDDLIVNIAEPFVKEPVLPATEEVARQRAILDGDVYKARRQVIYDSLYHIVSLRAPGSRMQDFIKEIRDSAGVGFRTSDNPSRYEVMQALMTERFRSGKYALGQLDETENNQRELVIQQALQLMQMSDQIDLMDRYALLLAAQAGAQVRAAKPQGTAAEFAPVTNQ